MKRSQETRRKLKKIDLVHIAQKKAVLENRKLNEKVNSVRDPESVELV